MPDDKMTLTTVGIRMPPKLKDQIKAAADNNLRNLSQECQVLIREALTARGCHVADIDRGVSDD